ncbi:MAG: enoyl-CoA hydratase/isomerase family protein, partial [Gammaproteobacteria bacterium]
MSEAQILFQELPAGSHKLGRVTFNVPATLNSLTLEMVDLLQEKLDAWRTDDNIAAVFIEGAGEKAFCAGGDVQALYQSVTATPGGPCEYAEGFFVREYRMNYTLHTYNKPIICWGHGIVMGGGLGVMAGCSHRLV